MADPEDDAAKRDWSAPTVDVHARRPIVTTGAPAVPDPSPFDPCADRWQPHGELGRGGMGRVEDAFDRALGRRVAIKHMLRAGEVEFARFEREARITARLEHPGIVPIHEAGRDADGTPYYVMRRFDGRSLEALVADASFADRLALIPNVLAACDAVAFAHAQGIIHRDLKPPNILVGPFGETLVIDWGLARETDTDAAHCATALPVAELTIAGAIAGTPGFMAPEQARGELVDARADVFALGATLFFVLAGATPYQGASATEMIALASAGTPPAWKQLPARVPDDLRTIVEKALASDPAQRYADGAALAADLRRFVTGNLVAAHRYGTRARLARFVRRHRAVVAVGAASVLVLATVAVLSVRRIVAERDDANVARALAEERRREAVDTSDQMLVARALALAATDPVGAIALLRRLDPASSRWHEAWLAATAAWLRGLPFAFTGAPTITSVELAADTRQAVTASSSGAIDVYDLATHTQRTVATLAKATGAQTPTTCHWIGPARLLCRDDANQLAIVDTEHASVRPLELRATTVFGDRHARAWVETPDHRVVEVTDAGTRELARDVTLAAASPELTSAVFRRGPALELWTAARTLPIALIADRAATVDVRDGAIAAVFGAEFVRWRVVGDRVVETKREPFRDAEQLMLATAHAYTLPDDQLAELAELFHGDSLIAAAQFPTTRGVGVLGSDGSIALHDEAGLLQLGPYPTRFTHADLAPDGRFLVAVSDRDELFAWDLDELRPRTSYIAATELPVRLAPPVLWTVSSMEGLVLRDHDRARTVLPAFPSVPGPWFTVAKDGRWAALRDPTTGILTAYDATRDVATALDAVIQIGDTDGLVFVRADGTVGRWSPGNGLASLGRFPSAPRSLAANGRFVVAELAPQHLARLDGSTAAISDAISGLEIAADGRVWVMTANGALWRWDLGAAPVQLATSEPLDGLVTQLHILAHTAHTVMVLGDEVQTISCDARWASPLADDYAAIVSANGAVAILDLRTGTSLPLRATAVDNALVASGDTLVFPTAVRLKGRRLRTMQLRVPHDARALYQWLR